MLDVLKADGATSKISRHHGPFSFTLEGACSVRYSLRPVSKRADILGMPQTISGAIRKGCPDPFCGGFCDTRIRKLFHCDSGDRVPYSPLSQAGGACSLVNPGGSISKTSVAPNPQTRWSEMRHFAAMLRERGNVVVIFDGHTPCKDQQLNLDTTAAMVAVTLAVSNDQLGMFPNQFDFGFVHDISGLIGKYGPNLIAPGGAKELMNQYPLYQVVLESWQKE